MIERKAKSATDSLGVLDRVGYVSELVGATHPVLVASVLGIVVIGIATLMIIVPGVSPWIAVPAILVSFVQFTVTILLMIVLSPRRTVSPMDGYIAAARSETEKHLLGSGLSRGDATKLVALYWLDVREHHAEWWALHREPSEIAADLLGSSEAD